MRMCRFEVQNGPFAINKFFFDTNHIIIFIYPLALFIMQNLKKFLQRIQSYEDVPFLGPNWSICPKQNFLGKIINIILIYLLAHFIVRNFKKNSSSGSIVMRMHNYWAQNGLFPQIRIFSQNLLMSLVSFIHAYLHDKNQSQISIY